MPKNFLAWYGKIVNNLDASGNTVSKENKKYRAIVNLQLATESVSRITQDLRQSFADKISNFGQNLLDNLLENVIY